MANPLDPRVEIGRVHLPVADLDRAVEFYSGVLGFEVTRKPGEPIAYLGAGGSHHHLRLTQNDTLPSPAPGLPRFSIRYPDRPALADALTRLERARVSIRSSRDEGVSESLHVLDPDGNGVELYYERPRQEWPRGADGLVQLDERPLDLDALRAAAATGAQPGGYAVLDDATRTRLRDLRARLLNLHKVLLDDARATYELDRGRVGSNANLLKLVISDPWFAWLHSLSELVVRLDETVVQDAPATSADAIALIDQVERLLTASETGDGFARRYYEALQRQPAVVLAHADVRRALKGMR